MQGIIVAVIVAYAAFVVLRRYTPKPIRQFVRAWSVKIATRMGWQSMAAKLSEQAEAGASCGNGCGSCGNCGPSTHASEKQSTSTISVEALKRTIAR